MTRFELFFLQRQRLRRDIADFGRSIILDRTRIDKAGFLGPLFTMRLKELERLAIQFDQRLLDDRLVLTVTALDVHHLRDRHTAGNPLCGRLRQVGDLGEISVVAILDEHEGIITQGIAVIGIKIGRECTSSLITQEMMQRAELAVVGTGLLSLGQLVLDESGEQLF